MLDACLGTVPVYDDDGMLTPNVAGGRLRPTDVVVHVENVVVVPPMNVVCVCDELGSVVSALNDDEVVRGGAGVEMPVG